MTKDMFNTLLIIHVLGDFYFQSQKTADNKKVKIAWVLMHSLIYAVVALILIRLFIPGLPSGCIAGFLVGHAMIDTAKYFICKYSIVRKKPLIKQDQYVFVIDQLFHILIILGIVYQIRNAETDVLFNTQCIEVLEAFGVSCKEILSWIVKIILIHKPANILISGILSKYKPTAEEAGQGTDKNIGRYIGTLERIVMVILISINQYSAVGLVLTAKSIARYDRISKEQEFAEYYLLGTLLSTIYAITVSLVL